MPEHHASLTTIGTAIAIVTLAAAVAGAQQPPDSTRRPPQPADTARPAQPIAGVRVEAAPAPATPAERRLSMGGHLYTKADIEKAGARTWMDAARLTAGVTVVMFPVRRGSTLMARQLSMRGAAGPCTPAIFVDGVRQNITEYDWDDFLTVTAVASMEVYSSGTVPVQFRPMAGSCGSVLIWTRIER